MQTNEVETFCPKSQQDWRQWLQENHQSKQSIWLIYYKKKVKYAVHFLERSRG
jgi:uncharacterized protein YdeI (YjbR/CyaY-like superfamily)